MSLLMPKRTKYRKAHRGRMKGVAQAGNEVTFGDYGIQALEPAWITAEQIESCRTTIVRELERNSKVWIRIFPDKPITKKPAESRMGKGKGDVEDWVAVVRPGRILFEMAGISREQAERVTQLVSYKLPIHVRLRERLRLGGEK
jgi:large subunit ribosomal protein L16